DVPALHNGSVEPFPAIFIRAPKLMGVKGDATVLVQLADGTAVAAQQGNWLVTSFHPELTNDMRFHQYFLSLIEGRQ
ncbi:MAG: pyridoxal 5'-phosphate synthase glutaminase subunit PdxT, partial [Chloroflexi bacterium]|nr:pyridoxal 5'-phosphate synthase glutaminase subunit PdxT [Chloroflexota bacterium]